MKLNDTRGFTLAEGLVSFVLMSGIMLIYLPALYLELNRLEVLQQEVHRWRQFYEVYQTYCEVGNLVELGDITDYEFKQGAAQVTFEDGMVLTVARQ